MAFSVVAITLQVSERKIVISQCPIIDNKKHFYTVIQLMSITDICKHIIINIKYIFMICTAHVHFWYEIEY